MHFPMFFDLTDRKVLVVGCGNIALRRISVLLSFGAKVTVVAPQMKEQPAGAVYIQRGYEEKDLTGCFFCVAATDDRRVNHQVYLDAKARGIPASIADCLEECSFFFPAICRGEDLVAGVVSDGTHHHKTARAARAIREALEEIK